MVGPPIVTLLLLIFLLQLPGFIHGFQPLFSFSANTTTHRVITQRAMLRKTAEVCRDIATAAGRNFSLNITDSLSTAQVLTACSSSSSASIISYVIFQTSIATVYFSNAAVDVVYLLSERHHFDDETFQIGRDLITAGVSSVKESVKLENFLAGRVTLGLVCHTLQDFYSHSNWVELGNKAPYSVLIQPDRPLEKLAGPDTPTCRNCTDEKCDNNILPDVVQQQLLTSGYFSFLSSAKPQGKCSHGGAFDRTSRNDPVGGINKDDTGSSHGFLHQDAVSLSVNATVELLEDIRLSVGDENFLRLMGVTSSSVLCFVIDTTGSMADDIAEAKRVSFEIIDSKRGTQQEPSAYILAPFNDPGVGPLTVTTDADIFKGIINKLSASGGGDIPELSLSGLQLALTAAPPSSEIFVFTDAPAKDFHLKSTITALIESTKSVVTFLLTDPSRRLARSPQGQRAPPMTRSDLQLYQDLAATSGGQAVEVTKSDLSVATSIIEDSSAGAVVTIFQVIQNPGRPENFTFAVDGSLQNLTVYITGLSSLTFSLTNPAGVSQSSSQTNGALASITTAGNLRRLKVSADNMTGSWSISIDSTNPYTVKVTGQSSVDFIFNIVEAHEGAHGDFSLKEGRPLTGGNVSALLTVTGSDTVSVTEIALVDGTGRTVNGSLQSLGDSNFLVTFSNVPAGDFVIRLRGEEGSATSRTSAGSSSIQRQAPTQFRTSSISLTAQGNTTSVEPNSTISVPFTISITANGTVDASATGNFTVRATNDRSYDSMAPSSIAVVAGSNGVANGTVTLTVPSTAASGSDVTLTIEAQNTDSTETNYVVLRFSVTAKVTDVTRPVCQEVSTLANCSAFSSLCSSGRWEFVANITDGVNGTGVARIDVRQGNGTFNTSTVAGDGQNVTVFTYSASCCSPTVQLVAVDGVGNTVTCMARASTTVAPTEAQTTALTEGQTTSAAPIWGMLESLWISAVIFLLGQ